MNKTLFERLVALYPDSSKSTLRKWLKQGRILVDHCVEKVGSKQVGQEAKVSLASIERKIPHGIGVIYEDKDLLILNKPEGLLSVATDKEKERCVHAILKKIYGFESIFVVHRLDRDTSGVYLFAKNEQARDFLKEKFAKHELYREYIAYVEGEFAAEKGTYTSYLQEDKAYFVRETEDKKLGEKAITHYEVLKRGKICSKIRFILETGKKNQIRVHSAALGCPILGDKKYGAKRNPVKRLCLHSRKMQVAHPKTGKLMTFSALEPDDMKKVFGT